MSRSTPLIAAICLAGLFSAIMHAASDSNQAMEQCLKRHTLERCTLELYR